MFDYLKSSYDLGEQFTNVECHTKDIEDYGISGTMTHFWLAPDGVLYYINYSHTADFVEIKEGDKDYNKTHKWCNFKWVSNGNHGKVSPVYLTKIITIYPEKWEGSFDTWPEISILFENGVLKKVYEQKTKGTK